MRMGVCLARIIQRFFQCWLKLPKILDLKFANGSKILFFLEPLKIYLVDIHTQLYILRWCAILIFYMSNGVLQKCNAHIGIFSNFLTKHSLSKHSSFAGITKSTPFLLERSFTRYMSRRCSRSDFRHR